MDPTRKQECRRSCCSIYRIILCMLGIIMIYNSTSWRDASFSLEQYKASSVEKTSGDTTTLSKYGEDAATVQSTKPRNATANSTKKGIFRPIIGHIKQQQIESYRAGNGLMLNIHPTHHGGTSFCGIIGRTGGPVASERYPEPAPKFVCWIDSEKFNKTGIRNFLETTPVTHDDTDAYIKSVRKYYHMTSWEYDGVDEMKRNLSDTNWDHPDLLSVVITRDPLSRMLAGGQSITNWYPGYNDGTLSHAGWWDYACNPRRQQTDNFFLRIIEGTHQKDGIVKKKFVGESKYLDYDNPEKNLPSIETCREKFNIDESQYQRAVSILNRFTVVLDIACLDDGFRALRDLLGLNRTAVDAKRQKSNQRRHAQGKNSVKQTTRERIGYDDVYDYLLEKHKWDIKLYEYSKNISLVDCDGIKKKKEKRDRLI